MMPTLLKISEISKILREDHHLSVLPRELNQMLMQTGDLVQTAINKVETAQGRQRGICGEYRNPDGREGYWLPLYNSEATQYVVNLALSKFPDRIEIAAPEKSIEPHQEPLSALRDCKNCMNYINDECGMPRPGGCSDYQHAYQPTEAEKKSQKNAGEGSPSARKYTQNALGEKKRG